MINPIIYPTAAQFWLNPNLKYDYPDLSERKWKYVNLPRRYNSLTSNAAAQCIAKELQLQYPVHILSQNMKQRCTKELFVCRCRQLQFPPKSFIKCGEAAADKNVASLYMASPELCFLEAAHYLTLIDLIQFGFDLCAMYAVDEESELGQVRRTPITTPKLINEYLENAAGFYGIKNARRAARFVLGNSNSPMETKLAMIMELPFSMGGFGLPKPELNYPIKLDSEGKKLLGFDTVKADIVWPEHKVAVEYNSNLCHLEPQQLTVDANRQTALAQVGYKVINITAGNMNFVTNIESIMASTRRLLGLRKEKDNLKKYAEKRRKLTKQMFYHE